MKYYIKTYGCQFNYSDSERVSAVLEDVGFSRAKSYANADLILFNTCSVRQKAEDRVFGMMINMAQLKKIRPHVRVGITGCMVRKSSTRESQNPDPLIKNLDEIDLVFRIEDSAKLPELLKETGLKIPFEAPSEFDDYFKINPKYSSQFQAFVPISTGCDKFCAYCIVPFTRGRERSRPMEEVMEECEKLVKNGCKEITLLGQNVDSYGLSFLDREEKRFAELRPGEKIYFTRLLEKIDKLKTKGLCRVRWTSPHPKDFTDDVIEAVATLKTQMPYIHLPVQAGSNAMLKKMNRPYTREHYIELIEKIRRAIPGCAISTDIVTGFCGETEKMFEETCELFEQVQWDMAYISQYSMRKFTAAYKTMKDDVSRKEKERRWHKLNEILTRISYEKHKAFVGKTVEVLVEKCVKGVCEGRSEHFKRTQFKGNKNLIGQIVPIKITDAGQWHLKGKILAL
ncbi:tRNA (N6-isopentenyl adenosine(37)-C2)-methylthiotransferase MiaB [Candidatus Peregrinibacteria bacterium]|nr:tRNA (N6-isopentenyl adenosine(37)-C2)-methylthiotransferase MiaB [Candidatus Peregrinibacteria bacterium]